MSIAAVEEAARGQKLHRLKSIAAVEVAAI
jgi:hypothetical protein